MEVFIRGEIGIDFPRIAEEEREKFFSELERVTRQRLDLRPTDTVKFNVRDGCKVVEYSK